MSYDEYIDMFENVQKKQCLYRAFIFDVVDSRNDQEYLSTKHEKFFQLLEYVYYKLKDEENVVGKKILLDDCQNLNCFSSKKTINGNNYNPMILGDMATYFVYNNSITIGRMLEIFVNALKEYDINYKFHFNTGIFETTDYGEGSIKLYKGYVPQILEKLSKENSIEISKDNNRFDEIIM